MLFDTTYVFCFWPLCMIISFLHTCLQSYSIVVIHTGITKMETGAHLGKVYISMSMCVINILHVAVFSCKIFGIFGMFQHVKSCGVSFGTKRNSKLTCTCIEFTEKWNHKSHLTQRCCLQITAKSDMPTPLPLCNGTQGHDWAEKGESSSVRLGLATLLLSSGCQISRVNYIEILSEMTDEICLFGLDVELQVIHDMW